MTSKYNENLDSHTFSVDVTLEITAMQPRLYGYILKRLADREQVMEVLQATNLVLCRKAVNAGVKVHRLPGRSKTVSP